MLQEHHHNKHVVTKVADIWQQGTQHKGNHVEVVEAVEAMDNLVNLDEVGVGEQFSLTSQMTLMHHPRDISIIDSF